MPRVLPSEVVLMLGQSYADLADHTAVGGERDLRFLSGIVAAANHHSAVVSDVRSGVRSFAPRPRREDLSRFVNDAVGRVTRPAVTQIRHRFRRRSDGDAVGPITRRPGQTESPGARRDPQRLDLRIGGWLRAA